MLNVKSDSYPFFLRLLVLASLVLASGCAHKAPVKPPPSARTQSNPVIKLALSLRGTPYVWGAESPEDGFDCSGFVQYVYSRHGILLPRTAYQMAMALPSVDDSLRKPGDLVFFNTTGKPYSHVGIYIGRNSFVHASSAKGEVVISSLDKRYWVNHFLGLRRPSRFLR